MGRAIHHRVVTADHVAVCQVGQDLTTLDNVSNQGYGIEWAIFNKGHECIDVAIGYH
ncbi:Hypothetical protein MVR_LOCUS344 [uncultured virus]|nr:Hypothetical protein MVR_LOCUS344 [uncultured virus]